MSVPSSYLIDLSREELNYPNLKLGKLATAEGHNPWVLLIEAARVGIGLIADLGTEDLDVVAVNATRFKEARAAIQRL